MFPNFLCSKKIKNCLIIISKLSSTICDFSSWGRRGDKPCSTKRKMAKHVRNILQTRYDIWIPRWSISNNPWHFNYSRPLGYVSIDGTHQLQIFIPHQCEKIYYIIKRIFRGYRFFPHLLRVRCGSMNIKIMDDDEVCKKIKQFYYRGNSWMLNQG